MTNSSFPNDIREVDMAAIEKRARQLRAEALQDGIASMKTFFANFGHKFSGSTSQA